MKVAGRLGRVKIQLHTQMPGPQPSGCLSAFQRGYARALTVGEQPSARGPVEKGIDGVNHLRLVQRVLVGNAGPPGHV